MHVKRAFQWAALVVAALALAGCSGQAVSLTEQAAVDAAWAAIEPNTSSHNRANWEAVEVRQVAGRDAADEFASGPSSGCWMGPTPPANWDIAPAATYWLVRMKPLPATPAPRGRTPSPTEPPAIPEPFLREAVVLLRVDDGGVVARSLRCVVY